MKALSIKQPWASLIAHGVKDIENRTWYTKHRGSIYIHVSQAKFNPNRHQLTKKQLSLANEAHKQGSLPSIDKLPYGAIIGEVDIIDCIRNHPSIWAEKDCWNWVLANPVLYDEPILNVKGRLSLWEFNKK